MGFDCVIEFCPNPPPPPHPFLFPLFFFGKQRGRFFCRGWSLGSRSVSSVPVRSQGFPHMGHHGDPLKKICLCISAERVCPCLCRLCICVRVFMHFRMCCSVCAPVSHIALLRCHLQPDKPKDLSPSELPLSGG